MEEILLRQQANNFSEQKEIIKMPKNSELRVDVPFKESFKVQLISGQAEINGVPLPFDPSNPVELSGRKTSIFFWKDSTIEFTGNRDFCYIGEETPMSNYLMGYYLIFEKRNEALIQKKIGPRLLILGSKSSGKRTITHTFINYSVKNSFKPIYVDLSLSNEIGIPGTIGATVVDDIFPAKDFLFENAILYFNGFSHILNESSQFSKDLYLKQIRLLGKDVEDKLESELNKFKDFIPHENQVFNSGSIIHCDFESDIEIYREIINSFQCDYIFVIDNDKLYSILSSDLKNKINERTVSVIKLQKSSGVVSLDIKYKKEQELKKINDYFCGYYRNFNLKPYELNINDIKILEIVNSHVDVHMLPIGKKRDLNIMIKEVSLKEPEQFGEYIGKVLSLNFFSNELVLNIMKTKDYTNYIDDICSSNVEFFCYM